MPLTLEQLCKINTAAQWNTLLQGLSSNDLQTFQQEIQALAVLLMHYKEQQNTLNLIHYLEILHALNQYDEFSSNSNQEKFDVTPIKNAVIATITSHDFSGLLSIRDAMNDVDNNDYSAYLRELDQVPQNGQLWMPMLDAIIIQPYKNSLKFNSLCRFISKMIAQKVQTQQQAQNFITSGLLHLGLNYWNSTDKYWILQLNAWYGKYPGLLNNNSNIHHILSALFSRGPQSEAIALSNKILTDNKAIESQWYSTCIKKMGTYNTYSTGAKKIPYDIFYTFIRNPTLFLNLITEASQIKHLHDYLVLMLPRCSDTMTIIEKLLTGLNTINHYVQSAETAIHNTNTDVTDSNTLSLDMTSIQQAFYFLVAKVISQLNKKNTNGDNLLWNFARSSFEINTPEVSNKEQEKILKNLHLMPHLLNYLVYLATTSEQAKSQSMAMLVVNTHQKGLLGGDTHTMTAVKKYNEAVNAGEATVVDHTSALLSAAHSADLSKTIDNETLKAHLANVMQYYTKVPQALVSMSQSVRDGSMWFFSASPLKETQNIENLKSVKQNLAEQSTRCSIQRLPPLNIEMG